MGAGTITENIKLNVGGTADVTHLDLANKKLVALDNTLKMLQSRIAGLSFKNPFRQTAAQFTALAREQGFTKAGAAGGTVAQLARRLGFANKAQIAEMARDMESEVQAKIKQVQAKIDRSWDTVRGKSVWGNKKRTQASYEKEIAGLRASSLFSSPSATTFKNPAAAGTFFEKVGKQLDGPIKQFNRAINHLVGGATAGPIPPGFAPQASPAAAAATAAKAAVKAVTASAPTSSGGGGGAAKGLKLFRQQVAAAEVEQARSLGASLASTAGTPGAGLSPVTIAKQKLRLAGDIQHLYDQLTAKEQESVTAQGALKKAHTLKLQAAQQMAASEAAALSSSVERGGALARTPAVDKSIERNRLKVEKERLRRQLKDEAIQDSIRGTPGMTQAAIDLQAATNLAAPGAQARQTAANLAAQNRMLASGQTAQAQITAARATTAATQQQQAAATLRRQATYAGAQSAMAAFQAAGGRIIRSAGPPGGAPNRFVLRNTLPGGQQQTMFARFGNAQATVQTQTMQLAPPIIRRPGGGGPAAPPQTWLNRGLSGFTPAGFARNLLSVSGWSLAVTAMMMPVKLLGHSLQRMTDIGLQTARLSQVFRNVGGSATQLTDDVLSLASATGQSTKDAMDSAVAWSRLGLTRSQVGEAVRVSLMAANVAEISSADATEHLASITAVYGLRVSSLEGVLGMLNQTSNTARVRNQDLLEGLSNVAAVGKEAGFSLAELQGLIGASVEISGQSGGRMGNALKNTLTRLGRPDVQDYLRNEIGVETQLPGGGEKSRAEVLREVFIAYQALNAEERTNLAGRVAGANQSNRFAAIMDSYVRAQMLAVESQLNLNSAQEENTKIVATLKSQLAGLGAEWDRMVVRELKQGNFASVVRAGKNVLRVANDSNIPMPWGSPIKYALDQFGESKLGQRSPGLVTALRGLQGPLSPGGIAAFSDMLNKVLENPFQKTEEGFRNKLQEKQMRASALTDKARLFETAGEIYKTGTPESKARLSETLAPWMAKNGDKGAAFLKLTPAQQAKEVATAKDEADMAAIVAQKQAVADLNARSAESAALEAKYEAQGAAGAERRAAQHQITLDLTKQSANATAKYLDDETKVTELTRKRSEEMQKGLNLLTLQAGHLESIAAYYQEIRSTDPMLALKQQNEMLDEQVYSQQAMVARVESKDYTPEQRTAEKEKLKSLLAAQAVAGQPLTAGDARRLQQGQLGAAQGRRYGTQFAYGQDETDKLMREQAALTRRAGAIQAQGPEATGGRAAELAATENRLLEIKNRLLDRRFELERDINQLQADRNKEFAKSMMDAGPTDLLRKLAAFRMSFDDQGKQKPMTLAGFMSAGPGMKEDLRALNPEFDPQMMDLQREKRRKQASPDSPNAPLESPVIQSAAQLSDSMTTMRDAVMSTTTQLVALGAAAMEIVRLAGTVSGTTPAPAVAGGSAPINPQSGGLGAGNGRATVPGFRQFGPRGEVALPRPLEL